MSEFVVRESTEPPDCAPVGALAQWIPIVAAPMAALIAQAVMYVFVDWSCVRERAWPIHATALVAAVATIAAGLLARRTHAIARAGGGRVAERTAFMGTIGMLAALLSFLTILAMWIPLLFLSPCHQSG